MTLSHYSEMAKQHPDAPELNVLVVGMPNVGKSTLLNSLRHIGIAGRESSGSVPPRHLADGFDLSNSEGIGHIGFTRHD